ncbi:MAG: amino acid adenylation domain-containing protein [Cyanobacteria bacterium P01_E01_bin.34]
MTDPAPTNLSQRIAALSPEQRALFEQRLRKMGLNLETAPTQQTIPRRPPSSGPLQVSFAQQRLWFLNQLETNSPFYNIPMGLRMSGPLDVDALRCSFAEIVRRHEILRTTFVSDRGQPRQVIHESMPITVPLIDLQGLPASDRQAESERLTDIEIRLPYDLEGGPLFRATVLRTGAEDHILLLSIHHTVADGWSRGVLLRELAELYAAFVEGKPSSLPELQIQYADFAIWQRNWLQEEQQTAQLQFWQRQLDGLSELNLPKDRQRVGQQTYRGAKLLRVLPQSLLGSVKQLSQAEGTTLFMTLLSVFKVLLHRYTGQTDIAVGSPTANRNWKEIEPLIGFFVNALVLRTDLSGDPTFRDVLHAVQTVTLDAFSHRDIPFENLVESLQPDRSLSYNPLFQVAFQFQDASYEAQNSLLPSLNFPNLSLERLEIDQGTSIFDLTVNMGEIAEGLGVLIEYSTDLFDRWRIEQMLEHFQELLRGAISAPDSPISQLPLLRADERHQLLVKWNATEVNYPSDCCIHQLFERQVECSPNAVAVVYEDQPLSYWELNERANQLAHHLQQLGVGPETLVGICIERSLEMVVGLLGILKAGGAYVPLDPGYPPERLAYMLADSQVPILLTQSSLLDGLPQHEARLICLDRDWPAISRHSSLNLNTQVSSDNLAYVIYTSGSTGRPKGVMNRHVSICNRLLWMQDAYQLTPEDRVLQKTPFSFDVSVWEFFWPLWVGAKLVLAKPEGHKDSHYLVNLIVQQNITTVHFVPPMLAVFLQNPDVRRLKCLKRVICSGEALSIQLQTDFFEQLDCELHNLYGPTEAAIDVTAWSCHAARCGAVVPIGRPIANTQIYILDSRSQPLPIGVPGELHIGGIGLARGYLNRPQLTAEKFIANPFGDGRLYKTGDLARYLPNGSIEYLGRLDHQVKIRGFRIELGEIEATLAQHPAIQASTVTVRKDRLGHQQLVAYVVSDSEQASPLSTLQQLKEQGRLTDGSLYELPNGMVISHLNKTETDFLYQEIYEAKCYLQHGITIRAGDCIFDVGANIGLFTLFAAQSAPDVSVYAFEPIPSVFEKLQLNVELYGLEATLFPLGVANEVRSESFTYYPNVSIISGRFGNVEQEKEVLKSFLLKQLAIHGDEETVTQNSLDELLADRLQSQTVACQLTTLSDVIREQGIDRIDLLKIDVEKSEQDILDGIHVQDWPKIKQLVVEVHNINGRLAKIQTLLQTHGYDVTVTQDSLLDRTELYSIYAKQGNSGSSSDSADSTLASLGASALQTEQVEFWQQLYNETYSQTPDELQGTFNITGWNSSYTGLPLPAAAMREWVDNTVERILALKPKRVLELGCGTGLLLFPVAPKCEQYWGTDFSAVALEAIRSQLDNPDLHLPQVQLEQRPADDFNGIPTAAFDTVVINSVIQYFPSADYLLETIAGALNALAPGGSLFIGDVRNFALIDSFHTALALHRAEADLEIARLQSRIHDEITRDKELLVQPTFFCALRERFPQIVDVRVQPKLGRHDNELTQYRYDVVLTIGELSGGDDVSESPSWQDWRATSLELKTLGETLEQSQPAIVALSNIPNGRTGNMQAAIAAISPTIGLDDEESPTTVEELRSYLQEQPRDSIDPQQIWDLGNSLNYSVEVSWLNEYPDGGFDAILRHRQAPTPPKLDFPIAAAAALPLQNLTNNPLQSRHSGELVPQLRDYLLKKLPDYMVPAIFVVMDELPLTPNGKIDRRALPDPDAARASTRTEFVQPKTPSEVAIAAIWSELLGVEQIGCNDHFFVLGGHSLLATQVLSRLQQELQVELPLRILFEAMTVAELAAIVDEAKGESGAGMTAIEPVARPEAIPLSFAQQRLWFVNQLLPDSPAYNMPAFVSLKGDLNVDALRRSLNEIVRRHETLRTNIREQKGTPAQIITKERLLELPIIEFQNSSMDGLSPEVEQWLLAEAKQPFNIESDPLLRVTLVKLADRDHILSVTMHHIVSDGWSAGILVKELAALYQAYISDRPSPLPELPIQYTDFAIWQRQHLKGERLEELLGFWQQQVAGMPDILDLPTDHPRPPLQTFNGTKAPIEFDAELTRSLLELGRRTDATLFMTLLAGFQLTIYAYTQQEKFLLGSPIANRNRPETEGLVGFFVNTLVLPADLSGDPTFEQLLGQVRESCLGAYSHQDLPFEKLLETIPFSRDLSRTPMVQAAFALQNAASTTLDLSGLTVSLADIDTGTAKIDLTVLMNARDPEAGDDSGLRGALEYNTDLFEAATANRIIELYRQVLKLATAQSDRPISQLLAEFDLSQCRPAPQTAVARGAQAVEERVASNDPQTQFEQLLEQTNLTANQLLIWLGEQLHPGTPL